jgi:hypothetical protein
MPYPIILNGDHAEFEREHVNTKPEDRPDWPLPSFDAQDWAKAFCRRFMVMSRSDAKSIVDDDDQIGLMTTWFANALMRGYDEHAARSRPQPESWDAPHNRSYLPVERRAKEIYDSFEYDGSFGTTKPAWTPSGNGIKQDEARSLARNELRAAGHGS